MFTTLQVFFKTLRSVLSNLLLLFIKTSNINAILLKKNLGQTNLIFRFAGETWKKVGAGVRNKNKNIVNFYKL